MAVAQEIITREQHDAVAALAPSPKDREPPLDPEARHVFQAWAQLGPPLQPGSMSPDRRAEVYLARSAWHRRNSRSEAQAEAYDHAFAALDARDAALQSARLEEKKSRAREAGGKR